LTLRKVLYICLPLVVAACASTKNNQSSQAVVYDQVYEDLSQYRNIWLHTPSNVVAAEPATANIDNTDKTANKQLDDALAAKHAKNRAAKYANGYRIQVYVGKDRKTADEAKAHIYQNFPNINPYMSYSLPIYKLLAGDFLTRADADRILQPLKNMYPDAILVSEKIEIKKSFLNEK
jgi:hypothetical protein